MASENFPNGQPRAEAAWTISSPRSVEETLAVGIIMGRHHLSKDRAFALLSHASRTRNVDVREMAHMIVSGFDTRARHPFGRTSI